MEGFSEFIKLGTIQSFQPGAESIPAWQRAGTTSWGDVAKALSGMGRTISSGWVKGNLFSSQGMCMLGAYLYGNGTVKSRATAESETVAVLLEEVIRKRWQASCIAACYILEACHGWNAVVLFNDSSLTSKADVLSVIGEALAIAEAREDAGEKVDVASLPPVSSFPGYTFEFTVMNPVLMTELAAV
jgi:hypothetical protein